MAEVMEEYVALKKEWGALNKGWVSQEVRDEVVEFVRYWRERGEFTLKRLLK